MGKPLHIVWTMANNTTAPYFSWFAARASQDASIHFSFVCLYPERPQMLDEMPQWGADAYWIPFDQNARGKSMLKAIAPLRKLFRKIKPDIVHAHLFDDAVPVLIAARLAGIGARIITKGDSAFHWHFAPKGIKYDRLNNRNASHIFALSEEAKEFIIEKEQANPDKVQVVHHGIPIDQMVNSASNFVPELKEKFGMENRIVIGTISRLIRWKGHHLILDAASKLVTEFPDLLFLFTGEGNEKENLQEEIKKRGLENQVVFTGRIPAAQIPSLFRCMHLFLHAASMEPFGLVIAEAMALGIPVVSTPTGASRDAIITGENGYLTESYTGDALAEGIRFVLNQNRAKLSEAASIRAKALFDLEVCWQNHLRIYQSASETA
jgi:glycosyltransferase involved in cell wall biosynthesis